MKPSGQGSALDRIRLPCRHTVILCDWKKKGEGRKNLPFSAKNNSGINEEVTEQCHTCYRLGDFGSKACLLAELGQSSHPCDAGLKRCRHTHLLGALPWVSELSPNFPELSDPNLESSEVVFKAAGGSVVRMIRKGDLYKMQTADSFQGWDRIPLPLRLLQADSVPA